MLTIDPLTSRKIRVMLVDDSSILLREATSFLGGSPGVEIVGSVHKTADAAAGALTFMPDVVLLDVTVQGIRGLPVISQLHAVDPNLPVIVLDEIPFDAVERGARARGAAFVAKVSAKTQLLSTILALVHSDKINA